MQRLDFSLKQTLKVSLGIRQTISMLQYNSLDIKQFIEREIECNPFLIDEPVENASTAEESDNNDFEDNETTSYLDEDNTNFEDESLSFNNVKQFYSFEDEDPMTNLVAEVSLKDHILQQVYIEVDDDSERLIAYYLTDMLLDSGYIEDNINEVSQQLKAPATLITKVLNKLQKFEPAGVFARSLAECLKIQLQDKTIYNAKYEILLQNLDKVAMKDYYCLAKVCKVSEDAIRLMIAEIKTLNPKPGSSFTSNKVIVKIPDIFVRTEKNGELSIEINKDDIPKVKVLKSYYNELKAKVKGPEQKGFLTERYQAAGTLISSIEQRNNAIIRISESIVRYQRNFFEQGVLYLRPLTLQDIARDTGLSESTVSRVTSNKYISTSYGLFELKYFFSRSLPSNTSSDGVSSTRAKEIIKKLIELENKNSIISDEEITKELMKFNIKIARRTVAKYRDQLKIPTACIRKREKLEA